MNILNGDTSTGVKKKKANSPKSLIHDITVDTMNFVSFFDKPSMKKKKKCEEMIHELSEPNKIQKMNNGYHDHNNRHVDRMIDRTKGSSNVYRHHQLKKMSRKNHVPSDLEEEESEFNSDEETEESEIEEIEMRIQKEKKNQKRVSLRKVSRKNISKSSSLKSSVNGDDGMVNVESSESITDEEDDDDELIDDKFDSDDSFFGSDDDDIEEDGESEVDDDSEADSEDGSSCDDDEEED